MRVAIVGCGAMGTVLGAYLTKNGCPVEMVDNYQAHVDAMNEKGLLGENVDGMYLTVDGETTDYSVDQSWWCLNVNGTMAMEGANTIIINDGDDFHWVYTIG